MNTKDSMNKRLCELCDANVNKIINKTYEVNGLSIMKVRDILMIIGKIYHEDIDAGEYFALIPSGFFKKNNAYFLVNLTAGYINVACYSEEGLINQHTSEGAISEFEKSIREYICKEIP